MSSSLTGIIPSEGRVNFFEKENIMISKICYGLGFASIGLSILSYGSYGIDMATYIGLWVPSFFLVGQYFDRKD